MARNKTKRRMNGQLNLETLDQLIDSQYLINNALRSQYRLAPNHCYADTGNKVALGICYQSRYGDYALGSQLLDFLAMLRNKKSYDCYVGELTEKELINVASLATIERRTAHCAWNAPSPSKDYFGRYVYLNDQFEIVEKTNGSDGKVSKL